MEEGGKLSSQTYVFVGFVVLSKVCVAKLTVNCGKENSSQGGKLFFSDSRLVASVYSSSTSGTYLLLLSSILGHKLWQKSMLLKLKMSP